ncbi:MAG TPA: apolipoprotein N-acyltransferase [Capsulimonadaceae bacterium]
MDTTLATGDDRATGLSSSRDPAKAKQGRRRALGAIATGVLLTLSFPHADLGFLAWIALVPFFSTFPYARTREAAGYGYLMGLVYSGGVAYWMGVFAGGKIGAGLGIVAWLLAAAIHAPLLALTAAAANAVWRRPLAVRLVSVAAAWACVEWLGELGTFGMGWGDLGYTQWHATELLQVTSVTGVFGLSFLIVLANIAYVSCGRRVILPTAILLAGICYWGAHECVIPRNMPTIKVAAIQGNINQDVEWTYTGRPADSAYFYGTLNTFDNLIGQAAKSGAKYVVLPETSVPGYIQFDGELKQRVLQWSTGNNIAVLGGARYYNAQTRNNQNVAYLVQPAGAIEGPYAKSKLVPFGEYVPYRQVFGFLKELQVSISDIQAGTETQPPLPSGVVSFGPGTPPKVVVGPMICFESTYSRFARRQVARGANLLTVITDDTWFGRTAAARQHLAMSAIRAAETRRSLVRAAATGISAVFDSRGRMVSHLDWYKKGIVTADVLIESQITPYVRYGDWFVTLCALLWCIALACPRKDAVTGEEAS